MEADGLIVGRRAKMEDEPIVRLGRVARCLLRRLTVPTVVVPPDLKATDLGDGPILLATDLEEDSEGAATFALHLGRALERAITVVHVVPKPDTSLSFLPEAIFEQLYSQLGMRQTQSLEGWMERHGLSGATKALAAGDVVGRILSIAKHGRSPIIVCGSRKLSMMERMYLSSFGSTLAAHAKVPVATVPRHVGN